MRHHRFLLLFLIVPSLLFLSTSPPKLAAPPSLPHLRGNVPLQLPHARNGRHLLQVHGNDPLPLPLHPLLGGAIGIEAGGQHLGPTPWGRTEVHCLLHAVEEAEVRVQLQELERAPCPKAHLLGLAVVEVPDHLAHDDEGRRRGSVWWGGGWGKSCICGWVGRFGKRGVRGDRRVRPGDQKHSTTWPSDCLATLVWYGQDTSLRRSPSAGLRGNASDRPRRFFCFGASTRCSRPYNTSRP